MPEDTAGILLHYRDAGSGILFYRAAPVSDGIAGEHARFIDIDRQRLARLLWRENRQKYLISGADMDETMRPVEKLSGNAVKFR